MVGDHYRLAARGQARGGGALGWLIVEGTVYEESWVLQNRGAQKGLPWPWGVKSGVTLDGHRILCTNRGKQEVVGFWVG